ncbi:ABC transporter substrate-binding protein [Nocardioides agariphilus]|uniref:ABC transporter substrate-binding protein n=1 Tax=Nocardioides agariphilus TaxID=433664 RepID=A0A930VQX7_9ACTN|nr:ABC transporter substrate-binding protein [Nocardioides agariphilus]MBF4769358.1 ABC transporter substrate-binding protein [Nocardioides agariphilus]
MMVKKLSVAMTALLLCLGLVACGGDDDSAAGGEGKLTFAGWGGTTQENIDKAWLQPYAKESGVAVTQDSPVDYGKVKQMVDAKNVIWDVFEAGSDFGLDENDSLTPMDCDIVACGDFDGGPIPLYKYGVPMFTFSVVLTYNTDALTQAPTSWADFFDTKKFPGKRAVYNGVPGALQGLLDTALIQDGVDPADLYPLDVDRALKKLDSIKDDIVFYSDFGQCTQLVGSGEAVMGNCYQGRDLTAMDEGQPIDFIWSGQVIYADYLMVPKGAPNQDEAMKLIAYITSAEHNGDFAKLQAYGPANPKTELSPDLAAKMPTSNVMPGADAPVIVDDKWWNDNLESVTQKWNAWAS